MGQGISNEKRIIVITGAAGLVGQNLVTLLASRKDLQLVGIDRHEQNLSLLQSRHPEVRTILADLAVPGPWQQSLQGASAVVQLHAEIVGTTPEPFEHSNIHATALVLETMRQVQVPYLVHVSSSAVGSRARDDYAKTKLRQEEMVRGCGTRHCVLRPTLMYGWFDPKHLGWLSRFMAKTPVFPIPGHGQYLRQPLYVRDFCRIIEDCIDRRPQNKVFDVAGPERIDYIEMMRIIKRIRGLRTAVIPIPVGIFRLLLRLAAWATRTPPFTTNQLESLTVGDDFPSVDILETFGVQPTPFEQGMRETLTDLHNGSVVLAGPCAAQFGSAEWASASCSWKTGHLSQPQQSPQQAAAAGSGQ